MTDLGWLLLGSFAVICGPGLLYLIIKSPGSSKGTPATKKLRLSGKQLFFGITAGIATLAVLGLLVESPFDIKNQSYYAALSWTAAVAVILMTISLFMFLKVEQRRTALFSGVVFAFLAGAVGLGFWSVSGIAIGYQESVASISRTVPRPAPKTGCIKIGYRAVINTPGDRCMSSFAGQTTVVSGVSSIALHPAAGITTVVKFYDSSGRLLGTQTLANGDGKYSRLRGPKGTRSLAFTPQISGIVRVRTGLPCIPDLERC